MIRVGLLFLLVVGSVCRADQTPAELLARAEAAFERAESLYESDPSAARAALDESIAAWSRLPGLGIENASIYRNIGTAFMLRGDTGRAVVSFRRAERLDPVDQRVQDSLAAARALVRTDVRTGARAGIEDAVLFWRGWVPRDTMLIVGLVGWALAWIAAALRIFSTRGSTLIVAGVVISVLTLGSLLAERTLDSINSAGVVVRDGVVGYRGPSESVYDPTFEEPIRAGVEATILESRDGWTRLRLRSGAQTWVRTDAIERI